MDEGVQRSFITQDMASRLHLKSGGTDVISISAFGDPTQTSQRLDTATVQLVYNILCLNISSIYILKWESRDIKNILDIEIS